jgi:2-haloalkanoic acid dehalogenase type II
MEEIMTRLYDVITFDCYGTLIDWEYGISTAFAAAAAQDGQHLDRTQVLQAYAELEPRIEAESYRRYRDVLTETAQQVAACFRWSLSRERAMFLAESLPSWPAFADTNRALERLVAAGYSLGILSNVDDDLLAGTCHHFTVPFDLIITAQQVGSYKPAHRHFTEAGQRIGGKRWLHAAQSHFHDVIPACTLGVPVAWINRQHESTADGVRADREFHTLTELADWLC